MIRARQNGAVLASVILVLAAAAWVRMSGLDEHGFWFDEVFTANQVTFARTLPKVVDAVATTDSHPPGHYVASWFWARAVGIWGSAYPDVQPGVEPRLRYFSVLLGLASIAVVVLAWRRFLGLGLASVVGIWMALSPALINQDREARMYPMLTLCVVLATYFLAKSLERNRLVDAFGLGLVVAVALYTQYLGLFLWGGVLLALLWAFRRTGPMVKLIALGLPVLAFSPWIPVFFSQLLQGRANLFARVSAEFVFDQAFFEIVAVGDVTNVWWFKFLIFPLFWILAAYATYRLLSRTGLAQDGAERSAASWAAIALVFTGLIPFFAWYLSSVVVVNTASLRYLGVFMPPILATVVLGIASAIRLLFGRRPRWKSFVKPTLMAVTAVFVATGAASINTGWHSSYEPWRELASVLRTRVLSGETILVNEAGRAMSLLYYYRPEGVEVLVPSKEDLDSLAEHDRIWVIVKLFPTPYLLPDDTEGVLDDWLESRDNEIEELAPGTFLVESLRRSSMEADLD